VFDKLHEQVMARIGAAGSLAQEHSVSFAKALDYSYLIVRDIPTLAASLGVREVTSRSGQQGIPIASTIGNT
jgi:hypothetical protein